MERYKTVDEFIAGAEQWQDELCRLREILLKSGLAEEIKWGAPRYRCEGKNVVGIANFKACFGLWFYQGALLKDDRKLLMIAAGVGLNDRYR